MFFNYFSLCDVLHSVCNLSLSLAKQYRLTQVSAENKLAIKFTNNLPENRNILAMLTEHLLVNCAISQ